MIVVFVIIMLQNGRPCSFYALYMSRLCSDYC